MTRSVIVKTAATSLLNTTTLTDDPVLQVALLANRTYLIDVGLTAHGYSGIGIKVNLQYTGTLLSGVSHTIADPYPIGIFPQNTSIGQVRLAAGLTDGTSTLPSNGGGNPAERQMYRAYVLLRTTTAGSFKVRWAPQSLHETAATIVHPGSFLAVEDVTNTIEPNVATDRRTSVAIVDQTRSQLTANTFDQFLYISNLDPGLYDVQAGLVTSGKANEQGIIGVGNSKCRLDFEGGPAAISKFVGTVVLFNDHVVTGSGNTAPHPMSFDGSVPLIEVAQSAYITGGVLNYRGGFLWNGLLEVATKGDLSVWWSQLSSNGNGSGLYAGSYLTAKRVA